MGKHGEFEVLASRQVPQQSSKDLISNAGVSRIARLRVNPKIATYPESSNSVTRGVNLLVGFAASVALESAEFYPHLHF